MLNKKLIIGANEITEVLYIGTNVHAIGGRKNKKEGIMTNRKKGFTSMGLGRGDKNYIPNEQMVVAKYHVKNYIQRNKKRRRTIRELITNSFQPRKCVVITLTFKNIKEENESSCQDMNIKEGHPFYESFKIIEEFDISDMSNKLFSPDIVEAKENTKTDEGDEKYHDIKTCNAEFKKFIKRMNYRYDNFKYVAVMSKQDNGNWHYHMVCNLSYIEFDKLVQIWRRGGVYIQKITSVMDLSKVTNYFNKNMQTSSVDLKGENGYLASKKGLNKNIELRSWSDKETERRYFEVENRRLDKAKGDGMKYINKYIHSYTYRGKSILSGDDDIFVKEGTEYECSCTIKYFKYPMRSEKFKLLDTAKPKIR